MLSIEFSVHLDSSHNMYILNVFYQILDTYTTSPVDFASTPPTTVGYRDNEVYGIRTLSENIIFISTRLRNQ